MINIKTLNKTYITFNNVDEFMDILDVFSRFGFNYKNGSNEDAIDKVLSTTIDKVICHDNFVMTSKEKVTTISYKVFMAMSANFSSNPILTNDNKKETMATTIRGGARAVARDLNVSAKLADKKWIASKADKAEEVSTVIDNFCATLHKAEDKANKVADLLNAFDNAFDNSDFEEVDRLEKLIDSSLKFITKTNKILAGINTTGEAIVKAEVKEEDIDGAKFIGE